MTGDLKKIGVPTLILHGDADQIVPIADSATLSEKQIRNATLKGLSRSVAWPVHDPKRQGQ